jgi:hypothetical protein
MVATEFNAIHEHIIDEDPVFCCDSLIFNDKRYNCRSPANRISQLESLNVLKDIQDRVRDRRLSRMFFLR